MSHVAPVLVETHLGEVGLFVDDCSADGRRRWSVGRPYAHGWQGIGVIDEAEDGYRAWMDFQFRAAPTVLDAVGRLVDRAAELDACHGLPAPLRQVPAQVVVLA